MNRKMKLEDIRIATPCSARWEEMIGNDLIRFCNICSKNVYNISAMSRMEAQTLINERSNLCGRIYMRKDGKVMTSDCPVGLAAVRKQIAKRASLILAVAFSFMTAAGTFLYKTFSTVEPVVPHSKPSTSTQPAQVKEEELELLGALGYIE